MDITRLKDLGLFEYKVTGYLMFVGSVATAAMSLCDDLALVAKLLVLEMYYSFNILFNMFYIVVGVMVMSYKILVMK